MPLVDPRTDRLVAVWGIKGGVDTVDASYTTSATERDNWLAGEQLGRLFYLHSGTERRGDLFPVGFDDITKLNAMDRGQRVFGYSFPAAGDGLGIWKPATSLRRNQDDKLGYGYVGPRTNGAIHSAEQTVVEGTNTLNFNLAAGGYLHSWEVGGVELLNRGNSWGRGLQQQLEFSDTIKGRLVLHRPSQSANRFNTGFGAIGSVFLSLTERSPLAGGRIVTIVTIPLELDPGGAEGVAGCSTDHGGDAEHPVLWTDVRVTTELWLDYRGQVGLHRLSTTWAIPFAVQSGFVDLAAYTAICLNDAFDQVVVHDSGLSSGTDVSAAVDAVDFDRWSVSRSRTFHDNVASPASASTLTSGFGGVYGRNTGSDLTVFLAGRLHAINSSDLDASLADIPRGNQVTYMTNRTGGAGLDGSRLVALGLDSNLSGRWYDHDQVRRIPAGSTTFTRWLSVGPLATALANALQIPTVF